MATLKATPQQILNNLFNYYHQANDKQKADGLAWYDIAHQSCKDVAAKYNLPLTIVTGIVAALSPRMRWEDNIKYAEHFINGLDIPVFKANLLKAERILAGNDPLDVLGGPKTRAFYQNLSDPTCNSVACIDSWMLRAAYSNLNLAGNVTAYEYTTIENAVKVIAKQIGLLPLQVQAIIWVAVRDGYKPGYQLAFNF